MKKIVFTSLFALCLPLGLLAQSVGDDLYYVPSKDNRATEQSKARKKNVPVRRIVKTSVYTSPGTTVVVRDRGGKIRNVDEYNRRYNSTDNNFSENNDTLYIDERAGSDLDGQWANGFDGSEDDYEYATRLIRFRNPRFAISMSSPYYWDIVYGFNSWNWNIYYDDYYAYAFSTFSNPLWYNWRFNSFGYGWNSPYYASIYWGDPYYSGWYGGYGGWGSPYGPWYGGGGHRGYHPFYSNSTYTDRYSYGPGRSREPGRRIIATSSNRRSVSSFSNRGYATSNERSSGVRTYSGRVVSSRPGSSSSLRSSVEQIRGGMPYNGGVNSRSSNIRSQRVYPSSTSGESYRSSNSSGRRVYTRPSSTRSGFSNPSSSSSDRRSGSFNSNRGYSSRPSYSSPNSARSYSSPSSRSSSSRSFSSPRSSGGSFPSSGGGGGGSRVRSTRR